MQIYWIIYSLVLLVVVYVGLRRIRREYSWSIKVLKDLHKRLCEIRHELNNNKEWD